MPILGAAIKRHRWAFALGVGGLVAGCAVFGAMQPEVVRPAFAFSHKKHKAEGLECKICHRVSKKTGEPGLPQVRHCGLCHQGIDEEKPPEKHVDVLFEEDGKTLKSARLTTLPEYITFAHAPHLAKEIACTECHRGVETSEWLQPAEVRLDMASCQSCHAQKQAPNECATCHTDNPKETPPASHQQHWMALHGQTYRAKGTGLTDNCTLCHEENTCLSCHRSEPPASHSQFWQSRHGLAAEFDRQSCATCHEADSCQSCHADTAPRSHNASWGAPKDNHCISCHMGGPSKAGCTLCHQGGTPSHSLATPKPAWHTDGLDCRKCHGVPGGQALPHVDPGASCIACHQ